MQRLFKDNPLVALITFLIVGGVSILLVAADTFQHFNTTGTLALSSSTTALVLACGGVAGLLFLLLCDSNRRHLLKQQAQPTTSITAIVESTTLPTVSMLTVALCSVLIGGVSLGFFLQKGPTAFEWPGIDMGPFFERHADPTFVPSDFFTNTSSLPNPRHIFGYGVLALTSLLGLDWYSAYFLLKVILVLGLPLLFFTTLTLALRRHLTSDARYLAALLLITGGVLATFIDRINGIFSIGWWLPIDTVVRPQTISLLLGLVFITTTLLQYKKAALPLLAIATLIHPSIGLFVFVVYLLLSLELSEWRSYLTTFGIGIFAPFAFLAWWFPANSDFSGKEFVYHYITENHAFHYLPSQLANYTSFPWLVGFGLISLLFIFGLCIAIFYKDSYAKLFASLSLMSYLGCVGAQYLFVELYPIKIVAAIGPIRFSLFGYWLLLALYSYLIARHLPQVLLPVVRDIVFTKRTLIIPTVVVTVYFAYFLTGLHAKDSPIKAFERTHPTLLAWVATTNPEAVFAVPPDFPSTHVPLLLRRSVFTGNGFPFTEDGFIEHNERKALIFGLEEVKNQLFADALPWEKTALFYRNLAPEDFIEAASRFRLDYVFVETDHAEAFTSKIPIYNDARYLVFNVNDL